MVALGPALLASTEQLALASGASTLLNDLLMQRTKMTTGRYSGPDYFTLD